MGDKRIDEGKREREKGARLATYLLCTHCCKEDNCSETNMRHWDGRESAGLIDW